MTLLDFVFVKLRTPKTWLDKCLQSPVLEHPWRRNMVNGPKHCWNLDQSTFVIFIDQCQGSWVGKNLCYWHATSWDWLLKHWMPMTGILFLVDTIWRYQLRCNYIRKKKLFLKFSLLFWPLIEILNILKQKMIFIDFAFPKLRTSKTLLDKCLKTPVSEYPSTSNMETSPNTVEICSTAPLSYLLITAKAIELEKASFIDMPNLRTVC